MAGAPLFTFERVGLRLEDRDVLHGISLDLPATGVTGVIGASGAGKSTLLRLCNRLEVPTEGRILFRGSDVAGLDPLALRRQVGMIFQRPSLFPGSVRDNLLVADPGLDTPSAVRAAGPRAVVLDPIEDELRAVLAAEEADRGK